LNFSQVSSQLCILSLSATSVKDCIRNYV
jgi:hypothetical protein